jgi:hypothetical protein
VARADAKISQLKEARADQKVTEIRDCITSAIGKLESRSTVAVSQEEANEQFQVLYSAVADLKVAQRLCGSCT